MRAVHLDFLNPRAKPGKLAWAVCAAGALVLVLAALATLFIVDGLDEEVRQEQARLDAARREIAAKKPAMRLASGQNVPEEWRRAIKLANGLNSPWAGLFGMLEGEVARPVKLLVLEADGGRQELAISGEAKNLEAMLAFINFLKEQPILADVLLLSHQVNQQDNDKPVRFRATARWVNQ